MGRPRSSYTLWILGHVLRGLFVLLVIFICSLLIWRMAFSQRPPKEMRLLEANAVLHEAYEKNSAITVLEQPDQRGYTEAEDNYAYYQVDWCLFLKEANQVQLLFFYNDSTLERASEKLGLETVLPHGKEVFSLEIVICEDVSPEGHEGDPIIKEHVIRPTSCTMGENSLYSFGRYVFDGVELSEDVTVVYLDVYYEDGARTELGTMRLYHKDSRSVERALTSKEEKIVKE